MNRYLRLFLLASLMLAFSASQNLMAQGNGGQRNNQQRRQRDPAQMMAQRMDRYRQELEVTSDDEWKALQPLIEKVVSAQGESRVADFRGARGQRGNRQGNTNANATADRQARPGAEVNPEADALRQAVQAKAPATDISAKLAKLREVQKTREAKLATARENLRKVLSVRQESIAVTIGLLK